METSFLKEVFPFGYTLIVHYVILGKGLSEMMLALLPGKRSIDCKVAFSLCLFFSGSGILDITESNVTLQTVSVF